MNESSELASPERETPVKALRGAIERDDAAAIAQILSDLAAVDTALAVSRLGRDEQARLMGQMAPEQAGDVLLELSEETAADVLDELSPAAAASIVDVLPSDRQADILGRLDLVDAERILAGMIPAEARHARALMGHDEDTAGGVMGTEYLKYREDWSVGEVVDDLRARSE
ncbi:MAG: magnesium transporter [Thermomicrobiales bacterium]|nr:magnesium transporter [Thermomicrobiales bacterium]